MTADAAADLGLAVGSLPDRLSALSRLVEIAAARRGADGFSEDLLTEAESLLSRGGDRLRLSAAHTVVALGGGTGSGKSSLFNALAGANFSPVAATRPTTRDAHACVWGMAGAAPLLDWLGVRRRCRYARASALDAGEASLAGLLLLDLPDHDSVAADAATAMDRLIRLADLMVWVLDPQKYADAAVHSRYLAPLARHATMTTVVLNQCDLLTADQARDCEADLRRLLDAEGLGEARLLLVSAATGAGLDELREVLADAVSAKQAATGRIAADIDDLLEGFARHVSDPAPVPRPLDGAATPVAFGSPVAGAAPPVGAAPPRPDDTGSPGPVADALEIVPPQPAARLADAFARAAGVAAVTDAVQDTRELRAAGYVYWPPARVLARLTGRDPGRAMRLASLSGGARTAVAGPDADQAGIDSAITVFADEVGGALPDPWPRTVRAAARSRAGEVRGALGAVVDECLSPRDGVPAWWPLTRLAQWLLLAMAAVGVTWIGLVAVIGVGHAMRHPPTALLSNVALLPWLGAMVVALLLLGWVTAWGCQNLAVLAADRERRRIETELRARIDTLARELVVLPAGRELAEYARFGAELTVARGRR